MLLCSHPSNARLYQINDSCTFQKQSECSLGLADSVLFVELSRWALQLGIVDMGVSFFGGPPPNQIDGFLFGVPIKPQAKVP